MAIATSEHLTVSVEGKVATLTMNQPKKLNALSGEMGQAAIAALRDFGRDPQIGAIVLTGSGRAFCAGGDVSGMGGGKKTLEQSVDGLRGGQEFPWLLYTIPKLTIAAVNGHAMGAGLGLACSCDLRIASDKAKFGTAYAKVGFGGDYGTSWQLTKLLGQAKAKEMFILGDIIEADEALRIGLVNRVVPADDHMAEVNAIAERVANGPLVSFRYMKENVNLAMTQDFRSILDREAMTHIRCGQTADHKEGIAAFMEKRAPQFTGE
jgi:2-(1,2-epoxy-1,2-dihydrophenyl)acetyl-CoA isomerase